MTNDDVLIPLTPFGIIDLPVVLDAINQGAGAFQNAQSRISSERFNLWQIFTTAQLSVWKKSCFFAFDCSSMQDTRGSCIKRCVQYCSVLSLQIHDKQVSTLKQSDGEKTAEATNLRVEKSYKNSLLTQLGHHSASSVIVRAVIVRKFELLFQCCW